MTAPVPQELAKLRDIHLPEAIGWWPLAPGWYLLALVTIVTLMVTLFFFSRHYLNGRARRQALRLLQTYQQQYQSTNGQLIAARISELLKRVALVYFPRKNVANLQGDMWIAFLNDTSKKLDFNGVRKALLEAPYQSATDCDLQPLFIIARSWINQRRGRCLN